jgi:uncharacterized membrane protein YiaA
MEEYFAQNTWVLVALVIWCLPWKGVALWKAARQNDKGWFIALLIINTLGLLEILYIFSFSKRKKVEKSV